MATIQETRLKLIKLFQDFPDPSFEVAQLMSLVLNLSSADRIAYPDRIIDPELNEKLLLYAKKRIDGVPFAYLSGQKGFYDLMLKVNEFTLIPRPETELLVDEILVYADAESQTVLDIGTGCGAIALAIGKSRPNWVLTASDISGEALIIAEENAKINLVRNVSFIQSDLFKSLSNQSFDIIVSNPPYIDIDDPEVELAVKTHEPHLALFSEEEGYFHLKTIISESREHLLSRGMLIVEHGYRQYQSIYELFVECGYKNIQNINDLSGKPRATKGVI